MNENLKNFIALKLGQVSMCWSERPTGVFQDEKVTMILDEIMEQIEIQKNKETTNNVSGEITIRNLTDNFVKIAKEKDIPLYYSNSLMLLKKLQILLNNPKQHFWNRLSIRKGSLIYFFLSRKGENYFGADVFIYKKYHWFLVRENKLCTYINKSITRKGNPRIL